MSHSYSEQLEIARAALPRDVAQAVKTAGWASYLRDKYDVMTLVKYISEKLSDSVFRDELHAAADKVRRQQPRVGRPSKQAKETARENCEL
jgi:hypothetical protein